jgi:hypothetical protein
LNIFVDTDFAFVPLLIASAILIIQPWCVKMGITIGLTTTRRGKQALLNASYGQVCESWSKWAGAGAAVVVPLIGVLEPEKMHAAGYSQSFGHGVTIPQIGE